MSKKIRNTLVNFIAIVVTLSLLIAYFSYPPKSLADGESVAGLGNRGLPSEVAIVLGETRATGLTAAAATPGVNLSSSQNVFSTVAAGTTDSAYLPTKANFPRDTISVLNQGAGPLKLFPPSGGKINNLTTTTGSLSIQPGLSAYCNRVSFGTAQTWVCNLGGGGPVAETFTTLAGLGSTQADCAPIVASQTVARVTGADGTVGVCLPPLASVSLGRQFTAINSSTASTLKVYSNAAGETITGQSGTTAISVAAKLFLRCWAFDASNWYCEKGVLPY